MAIDRYSDNHTISVSGGSGTLIVDGSLDVTGDISIGGSVSGNLDVTGNLSVSGDLDVSQDLNVTGNIDTSQTISANAIEANSFSKSSSETRRIWIPAIFLSHSGSTRSYDYSAVENYADGGESGSAIFAKAESIEIDGLVELFLSLNPYLNKADSIIEIEVVGSADGANHVIHYTLENDRYNGTSRTISSLILDSDNANIIRTLDTTNVYIKTASSGNFSHVIYPTVAVAVSPVYSGSSYNFRIFADKATYTGTGSCYFDGIYLTVETTSVT
jgi:hypothetical protein